MKIETQRILASIEPKVQELLKTVYKYDSDTFDARGAGLTRNEAVIITTVLVSVALDELIELDRLDGVRLSEELENIRE